MDHAPSACHRCDRFRHSDTLAPAGTGIGVGRRSTGFVSRPATFMGLTGQEELLQDLGFANDPIAVNVVECCPLTSPHCQWCSMSKLLLLALYETIMVDPPGMPGACPQLMDDELPEQKRTSPVTRLVIVKLGPCVIMEKFATVQSGQLKDASVQSVVGGGEIPSVRGGREGSGTSATVPGHGPVGCHCGSILIGMGLSILHG